METGNRLRPARTGEMVPVSVRKREKAFKEKILKKKGWKKWANSGLEAGVCSFFLSFFKQFRPPVKPPFHTPSLAGVRCRFP